MSTAMTGSRLRVNSVGRVRVSVRDTCYITPEMQDLAVF